MEMLVPSEVRCPHCWRSFTLEVDTSQGDYETVEECGVCCRQMTLQVVSHSGDVVSIEAMP